LSQRDVFVGGVSSSRDGRNWGVLGPGGERTDERKGVAQRSVIARYEGPEGEAKKRRTAVWVGKAHRSTRG